MHIDEHEMSKGCTGRHLVICGPPGSGKTTRALAEREGGDIVFDLDALAAAINPSFARWEDRPPEIASMLLGLRDDLVGRIVDGNIYGYRVIIIISGIGDAETVAAEIDAELLECNHGQETRR